VPGRGYQFIAPVRVTAAKPPVSAPAAETSIAVLPFANLSADPNYEYFGAGLAEEIINSLSRLKGIRVAARRSAFFFQDRDADIHEIADRLGVNLVLEGSVRKSGNRLRITAQLINAAGGYQLWSERYDREIDVHDIFDVQDEITLAVVDALKLKLPHAETSAALKRATDSVKAHELYLKGQFHLYRMTRSGYRGRISYLKKAMEADLPNLRWLRLAWHTLIGCSACRSKCLLARQRSNAKAAAQKAVEMDGNLAEAHAVLAFTSSCTTGHGVRRRSIPGGLWNSTRTAPTLTGLRSPALESGPASGSWMRPSRKGTRSALWSDERNGRAFLLHAGQTDGAIDRLREALELDPNSRVAHLFAANAYIEKVSSRRPSRKQPGPAT
jgi:TolB-like protein